tara:strand:+ start:7164 stop:7676 length:513 start_codon:yes stop_codon:yes gene_type:complete
MPNFRKLTLFFLCFLILGSCGGFKKTDTRKTPISGPERARKNVEEGRGISIKNLTKRKNTFQFSSSNPMWRASLEVLDFLPLTTVDYSGGIIITDWYSENLKDDSIKITIRFLSNEIQSNSLKVIVHSKDCAANMVCVVKKIDSRIDEELKESILRKASLLSVEDKKKKK